MSKQKPLTNKNNQYWLPASVYKTAVDYARSYSYYKKEAESLLGISGLNYDGLPHSSDVGRPTESKGLRYAELNGRCKCIEKLCEQCLPESHEWLLEAVGQGKSYDQLLAKGLECSRRRFYKSRQKFYYCLAKKINIF